MTEQITGAVIEAHVTLPHRLCKTTGSKSAMPKLPKMEHAVVDLAKLRDYSLNPSHRIGKHKARVFRSRLGLTLDDAEWLQQTILEAVRYEEAHSMSASPFGVKYVVDILVTRGPRSAIVRTAWIIEYGKDFPRLTSCYVK